MARVFRPKAEATEYAPTAGETLDQIVKTKCEVADPPITCDEVCLFNWGTKEKPEVLRALVELVGCRKVEDPKDPFTKCELDPTKGLKGKILLPKVWKKTGLPYEKIHKLKVKEQLPATAISITKLDKWFLPGEEACEISYALEGIKPRAEKVAFDAYASNYAKATATNDGEFVKYTYAPLLDEKIVKRSVVDKAEERSSGDVPEWKGESEATTGLLHKRKDKPRFINAASAPYSVNLLYYKTDGQNPPTTSPLVRIESFWVRWDGTGVGRAVVADSLKIKWTGKNLPGGLQGQLQVWDKDGIVWRQFIPTAKCGNGDQTIDWGTDGTPIVKEDQMPYRVQIQLHTDKDTAPGFGIAAMHTDVRVFMHTEIGTFADDHEKEPQVLKFALAPHFAGTAPAENSGKGRKLRLARGGYHPGPVNDDETTSTYLMAVKEIQRDSQQPGVDPKVRIKADGTIGADTKAVIAALNANHRPMFATADRNNLAADDAINSALNDKATEMIAWLNDRHNFTKPETVASENASSPYLGANMWLENYRGKMNGTDVKRASDATSICRPYLPIETDIPLLRKASKLIDTTVPAVNDASRAATGPIRVDWTFRDLPWKDNVNATYVTPSRTRPRKYLAKTFDAKKGTHNGKDAHNCPAAQGGIRGGAYFANPFGKETFGLMPWRALSDGGPKAVCSVVHDDLEQEEARVFATHLGKAGVYLNPSIIGGDGYQFRGQVSFADLPGEPTHPNWKTLRDRYDLTKLPQAHSAPIRLWRKDTWKGYIPWAPPSGQTWGTATAAVNTPYEPGFVHFEHEGGASHTITIPALLPGPGGPTDYRNLIAATTGPKGNSFKTDRYRDAAEITLDPNNVWPWSSARHLGIQAVPAPGVTLATYDNDFLYKDIWNDSWRSFRGPLLHFLLTKIEASQSLLRGHLICEFAASPQYWKEKYYCDTCTTGEILIELTAGGGSGAGEGCRSGVCLGTLQSSIKANYRCDTCPRVVNGVSITKGLDNSVCGDRCTGNSQQVTSPLNWLSLKFGRTASVKTEYKCSRCSRLREVVELENQVGTHQQVCNVVCAGRLHEVPGSRTAQEITANPSKQLNLPSAGEALGVLMCGSAMGPFSFWAHEVAHHKHFEHAGDVIQVPAQHDRAANAVDATVQSATDVNAQKWDRACIMSYVSEETGADKAYFCGKCVLKMRGWIVESGIADPAGGEAGP